MSVLVPFPSQRGPEMNTLLARPDVDAFGVPQTTSPRRQRLRSIAAALAGGVAVLYVLIAANLVTVVDGPAEQVARDQLSFAGPAAAMYALGALLLWRFDRRWLWVLGAVLQVMVVAMYFTVAPERDPAFEVWGLSIRVLQIGLLVPLVLLAARRPRGDAR